MKPELKEMIDAYQRGYESQWDGHPSPWLAALHLRDDEIWCVRKQGEAM